MRTFMKCLGAVLAVVWLGCVAIWLIEGENALGFLGVAYFFSSPLQPWSIRSSRVSRSRGLILRKINCAAIWWPRMMALSAAKI